MKNLGFIQDNKDIVTKEYLDAGFEPLLPAEPSDPTTKYLNGLKQWSRINIGSGGYASNVYLTNQNSSINSSYKKLSYGNDVTEQEYTITRSGNGESPGEVFIFDEPLGTTVIDAGTWKVTWTGKVSSALGVSRMRVEGFLRASNGTETTLFSEYTDELDDTDFTTKTAEIILPIFSVQPTDRLGFRTFFSTTLPVVSITGTVKIGGEHPLYINTPLALRHNQLRGLNEDEKNVHVTSNEHSNLTAISALSANGFIKRTGTNTYSIDTSTYSLSNHDHNTIYQPLDGDLTSIAGLTGTNGLLKKTAANTWTLDTTTYMSKSVYDPTNQAKDIFAYVDGKVKTDVPAGAIFTDTVYVHPTNHPPSIITQDANNRFVTDTEKSTWSAKETTSGAQTKATQALTDAKSYVDGKVKTDVPTGAIFTDTIYVHPNHSGDVISVSDGATTISNNVVTNAKLAKINTNIIKGRKTAGNGNVEDLTASDVRTIINVEDGANKYTHPTNHPPSIITQDANNRFVTDTEKSTWSAKWDYNEATIKAVKVSNAVNADTVNGKTVAVNVPSGAIFTDTVYTHPANHPPSIITQDTNNRFVTDAEKTAWNSKETTSGAQAKATQALTDAKSYVDGKVKTNVPENAKFTDTVYTHPNHTGDVTSTGDGATSIGNNKVTNAKLATVATNTIKGRKTTGTGNVEDLTASEARSILNVADGANNYTHPANHPPSIITQDANNRFVTDAEKTAWNAKPNTDTTYNVFTTSSNGLVPKSVSSNTTDFLRRDGSWAALPDYSSVYQAKSTNLTNIAALSGTSGILKKTGSNTWKLDTEQYTSVQIKKW